MSRQKAAVLTNGYLATSDAKTAHGLIRASDRFQIVAVIDPPTAGRDAGEVLDGQARGIPVVDTVEAAKALGAEWVIVGVAVPGGALPSNMLQTLKKAMQNGLSIVNGLHDYLNDRPDFTVLALHHGVTILDVRRPKPRTDLHFWTGDILKVKTPIVAVMGTDCGMGKRTTTRFILEACQRVGIRAEMIYTGQTGWMQGGKYGFIFDSTLNDFISGELEHAILTCIEEAQPDIVLLEGQSGLRNPTGPCGSEYLLSGNAKHVILLHAPKREYYHGEPDWGKMPSIESEIALIAHYGSKVIALALSTGGCTHAEAVAFQQEYEARLGIPVLLPLEAGVERIVPVLKELMPV